MKIIKLFAAFVAALALSLGVTASADAAPKPTVVQYSYHDVTVVDADGTAVQRNFIGKVTTSSDGTQTATCWYGKYLPNSYISEPDGSYSGPYTGATTSNADIKAFCVSKYASRIT